MANWRTNDSRNEERLNPAVRLSLSTNPLDTSPWQQGSRRPVKACGSERSKLLGGSGFGSSGRSGFNSSSRGGSATAATAARVTTAAAARAATTAAAATVMTTTAARRRAARARAAARTTAATTTTARATAAGAAAAATVTESRSFLFTTDEGHANQREEHRDTQDNDTVHS